MYEYQPCRIPQSDLQRLGMQAARPPDSIIMFLRGLRRMLTVKEAARILGRHRETVYEWIAAGLPATKQGRTWRIDPIRLAAWLESK